MPSTGPNASIVAALTATSPDGLTASTTRTVLPDLATLTVAATPSLGLTARVAFADGTQAALVMPGTLAVPKGSSVIVSVPSPQPLMVRVHSTERFTRAFD